MNEYTTLRIHKSVKEKLDSINPESMSYSERINYLFVEAQTNETIETITQSIEQSTTWTSLEDFEKELRAEKLL